jgi:dipeptidyl aminopeptidase/acylaminoacyl peptidase
MRRIIVVVFAACALMGVAANAQTKVAPLTVEDAINHRSFPVYMPLALSPDGKLVAYTLELPHNKQTSSRYTPTGVPSPSRGCHVWITDTETGETENLTEGKGTSSWAPVWSPDGKSLAFYSDGGGTAGVWLWERATRKMRQVSNAIVRPYTTLQVVRWTPDSKRILTRILREGSTLEDGQKLIKTSILQADTSGQSEGVTAVVYTSPAAARKLGIRNQAEPLYTMDVLSVYTSDLALIDVDSGAVKTIVSGVRAFDYWVSPDGLKVCFSHMQGRESDNSSQYIYDLVVHLIPLNQTRVLAPRVPLSAGVNVSWSPDSKLVSYIASGPSAKGECYVVPLDGGGPRRVAKSSHPSFADMSRPPLWDAEGKNVYFLAERKALWKVSMEDGLPSKVAEIPNRSLLDIVSGRETGRFWSPDGGRSLFVSTRDDETKQIGFYRIDLTNGTSTRLLEENKSYGGPISFKWAVSADARKFVFVSEDTQHPPDIWQTNAEFAAPRQLTRSNPHLAQYKFGSSRLIEWRSLDGRPLKGALILPADYREGQRYPMLVYPYPLDRRSENLNEYGGTGTGVENMQLFATRGYAVLLPDVVIGLGTVMSDVAKTILPGVNKVIDMGIADPDRVGVMGHSYGGYTVLALLVQTIRFRAGVMRGGYGNAMSLYGDMEKNGSARAHMLFETESRGGNGGTPWEYRERYIENSPVFFFDRVQTPLLIIHGGAESNVQVHHANEVFVDLRRLGKEVVYARYEGEDHGEIGWSYENQIDYCKRIIDWFDRHLKSDSERARGSKSTQ